MANLELPPDGLAKRIFVMTMLGVLGYITAVVLLISSHGAEPSTSQGTGGPAASARTAALHAQR